MIEAILDSMDSWDEKELRDWARGSRADDLEGLDDETVAAEYEHACVPQ
jgi:hypothetical protein